MADKSQIFRLIYVFRSIFCNKRAKNDDFDSNNRYYLAICLVMALKNLFAEVMCEKSVPLRSKKHIRMELVDNSHKAKDKLRIYSLLHKATKPLHAIDFLFREVDSKLEWMLFSGNLRSGCFIGKDDLSPFEDFTDFIEYRKELLS